MATTKKHKLEIELDDGTLARGYELDDGEYLEESNDSISEEYGDDAFGYFPDDSKVGVVPSKELKDCADEIVDKTKKALGRQ